MSSRLLTDLCQEAHECAVKHIKLCDGKGIELLVYCTYRSNKEQDALYKIGRSLPGRIVTNARGGQSDHNAVDSSGRPASRGYDCVPLLYGKPQWDTKHPSWRIVIEAGEESGLVASARWQGSLRETCHFAIP